MGDSQLTRVKRHDELFVTDGFSIGTEARHLYGPVSDFNQLIRTYDHDLLMAAGVPPQKLGTNAALTLIPFLGPNPYYDVLRNEREFGASRGEVRMPP